jgi:hypothetical protein
METFIHRFDRIFGCHHRRLSRVFTIRSRTYRVSCSGGARFKYSLETMSVERRFRAFDAPGCQDVRTQHALL